MVRLDRILVKNFKNIESAEVVFSSLNVLVGPNGSGKSNFLLILSFLNHIINGSSEDIKDLLQTGRNKKFGKFFPELSLANKDNSIKKNELLRIELDFSDDLNKYVYQYRLSIIPVQAIESGIWRFSINDESFSFKKKSQRGKLISIFSQKNNVLNINKEISSHFSVSKLKDPISGVKFFDLILKTSSELNDKYSHALEALNIVLHTETIYLSSHALKYNNYKTSETQEGRLINFDFEKEIIGLEDTPQWNPFLEAVKNISSISKIEIIELDLKDKTTEKIVTYDHKNRFSIKSDLSDGEVILLAFISKIFTNTSDILFLEELENSVHPNALKSLISLMRSYSQFKQFLISTHSVTLLNLIKPDEVFVSCVDNRSGLADITMIKDIKELKRKLNQGFINFGDLVYETDNDNFEDVI